MKLTNKIEMIDLALLINRDTLIISDIHLGYEDALINQGYLVPRHQYKDTLDRLDKILKTAKPKTIIINGDLKHQFGSILRQEYADSIKFLNYLLEKYNVILIKGNHDNLLDAIAEKSNLKTQKFYAMDDIYIFHGDYIPDDLFFTNSRTIIIGHDHPAISLEKNRRFEKYKCFLKGKYKNKELIVQPSFNMMAIGTDVAKEKLQSPLISNVKNFELYAVEDKIYNFGKIFSLLDLKDK